MARKVKDKKKITDILKMNVSKSYAIFVLLFTIICIGGYYSYAMFTVEKTKNSAISIVTGNMIPTLTSTDMTFTESATESSGTITLPASSTKVITINLKNDNKVAGRFQLYYKGTLPEGVSIYYTQESNDSIPSDGVDVDSGVTKTYELLLINVTESNQTFEIGSRGGLTNQTLVLDSDMHTITKVNVEDNTRYTYSPAGSTYQVFVALATGNYKVQLWGSQGTSATLSSGGAAGGGFGAYTEGTISLTRGEIFYVYVGTGSSTIFNGNGSGSDNLEGGSATDVRLVRGDWDNTTSLASRIMVAAGGGSGHNYGNGARGGWAGGLTGETSTLTNGSQSTSTGCSSETITPSKGGSQTAGGTGSRGTRSGKDGSFGKGGDGPNSGGGGGYYGGGGGYYACGILNSGAGGSSYISGHTGCVAITSATSITPKSGCTTGTTNNSCSVHYSGKVFISTRMVDGNGYQWTNVRGSRTMMPNKSLTGTMTGSSGTGQAIITYLSSNQTRYTVSTRTVTGGSISVSTTSAYSGSTVTFTPASTSGFSYYGATLRNASGQTIQTLGTNERSFVMPDQAVTISPKWRKNDYIIAALDQSHVGSWTQKSEGANNATFTFNTSRHYLSVNFKTTANSRIYAWTSQTFDLTHYETYQVNVNESWSNNATHPGHSHFSASVSKTNTGTIQNGIGYQISQGKGNEVRFYLNVPISDLTGNYYLGIDFYNNGQAGFCDMTHATLIGKVYE